MSLDVALQDAVSGLRATQSQIQVLSGNIVNAQTPGYSEETLSQTSVMVPTGGAGVETGIVQRASDQILTANLATQTSTASAASTTDDYLQQLQNLLGQVGSNDSIANGLSTFQSAMQAVATTPDDPVAQSAAVNAGQQLAQQLNDFSSGIQNLRQSVDGDIANSVTTANTALQTIATLNGSIANLTAAGQSTATLEDQRDQAVSQLAQLVGVTTFTKADGTMVVMTTGGQSLVDNGAVAQFGYTQSGTVTGASTLSPVTLDGANITSSITTGTIGALLQLGNTTLPGVTAQLNQFTNNLFNQSSTANLNTTNSGLNATNDANNFFANVNIASGVDNAATIEVNPSLVQNPDLLQTGTLGPDQTISQNLASNLGGTATFAAAGGFANPMTTTLGNYAALMIGQTATIASQATQNDTYQTQLQTQMQNQLQSETGVNLDQELSNLEVYQNAYGASARVISTIQNMYDALMNVTT
jgi:flagellar hook-associated protein 1 FlgK